MNYSLLGVLWHPYPSSAYLDRINDGELTSKKRPLNVNSATFLDPTTRWFLSLARAEPPCLDNEWVHHV